MRMREEVSPSSRTPPTLHVRPAFTLSSQRRGEGAAARAQQGDTEGGRCIVGGGGARRGPALREENLGPLGQGAAPRGAGAGQQVEGRRGTLLAVGARAGPWGRRTTQGAASAVVGTGPGRGRAVQAAVGVRLQVDGGARGRRPALRGQRAVGEQSRGALRAAKRGVRAVAGRLPGGPAAAEGLWDRAGAVPGQLGRDRDIEGSKETLLEGWEEGKGEHRKSTHGGWARAGDSGTEPRRARGERAGNQGEGWSTQRF